MNDTLKRGLLASAGVFCVVVAAVGAVLPGIPTLGPLLFGSILLAKSHPALEKRLVRNRFFAPYLPYIDGKKQLTPLAKCAAGLMMWTSITISGLVLWYYFEFPEWALVLLFLTGLVGTYFIWRFGRIRKAAQPID